MHGRQVHEIPAFQARLDRQATRTGHLRRPLYARAGLSTAQRVLDVGCGSGGVTADLLAAGAKGLVAVDADEVMVKRSRERLGHGATVLQADGRALPFRDHSFDVVVCNLVLLWTPQPEAVAAEMARVVRPGGVVLASMEPDYGGKIHHPENPVVDLVFQGDGIRQRGGDPHAGRKLRSHFVRAGLRTQVGISNLHLPSTEEDLQLFKRNRAYYRRMLEEAGFAAGSVDSWEAEYVDALEQGIQLSFLPIFHALGRKPVPGDLDGA